MSDVRPIDANDLKRDFAELCATECAICSFYISSADVGDCHCGLIDRAPAVETYTKDDMTNEYLKGYNDSKRPAEWEESVPEHIGVVGEGIDIPTYECSNPYCAMTVTKRTLYCPNCGRRMKND